MFGTFIGTAAGSALRPEAAQQHEKIIDRDQTTPIDVTITRLTEVGQQEKQILDVDDAAIDILRTHGRPQKRLLHLADHATAKAATAALPTTQSSSSSFGSSVPEAMLLGELFVCTVCFDQRRPASRLNGRLPAHRFAAAAGLRTGARRSEDEIEIIVIIRIENDEIDDWNEHIDLDRRSKAARETLEQVETLTLIG